KGQVGVRFALGGVNFYSMGRSVDSKQRQINIVDNLSYDTGAHQLKFGVDYRRLSPIFGPNEFFRQLNFDTQNDIRTGRVTSMTTDDKQGAHPLFTNFSAYGQDSWKVSPHITITYGLRWEINPPPGEADNKSPVVVSGLDNPATATLAQPGSPLYHTTYRNFA